MDLYDPISCRRQPKTKTETQPDTRTAAAISALSAPVDGVFSILSRSKLQRAPCGDGPHHGVRRRRLWRPIELATKDEDHQRQHWRDGCRRCRVLRDLLLVTSPRRVVRYVAKVPENHGLITTRKGRSRPWRLSGFQTFGVKEGAITTAWRGAHSRHWNGDGVSCKEFRGGLGTPRIYSKGLGHEQICRTYFSPIREQH